ncbi:MAG: hypothetical protein AB7G21_03330 [Dehalococcoidia bacterium]
MSISSADREQVAAAFNKMMPAIAEMLHTYVTEAGAPERFFLGVYDASDAGGDWAAGGDPVAREIASHEIRVSEWINDHKEIARKKVRAALRTGVNTGDHARSGGTFTEDEVPYPGGCIADAGNGAKVVVSTSGLKGPEDEFFSLAIIQLLQRALTPAS